MEKLVEQHCQHISESSAPLTKLEIEPFFEEIKGWHISPQGDKLIAIFHFKNYYETIAFVNAVAWVAHQEDHHPDLLINYNQCHIRYNTHTVKGISQNDLICAAKINQLLPLSYMHASH